MNKIDSRFLDFNFIVRGMVNEPPVNPQAGDQYIVGANPTGAFEGASEHAIARYNGSRWAFYDTFYNRIHKVFDTSKMSLIDVN